MIFREPVLESLLFHLLESQNVFTSHDMLIMGMARHGVVVHAYFLSCGLPYRRSYALLGRFIQNSVELMCCRQHKGIT